MLANVAIWLIFGSMAGWIATLLVTSGAKKSAIGNVFTGILGAMLGGLLARLISGGSAQDINITSLVIAIVGSIGLIALVVGFRSIEG